MSRHIGDDDDPMCLWNMFWSPYKYAIRSIQLVCYSVTGYIYLCIQCRIICLFIFTLYFRSFFSLSLSLSLTLSFRINFSCFSASVSSLFLLYFQQCVLQWVSECVRLFFFFSGVYMCVFFTRTPIQLFVVSRGDVKCYYMVHIPSQSPSTNTIITVWIDINATMF